MVYPRLIAVPVVSVASVALLSGCVAKVDGILALQRSGEHVHAFVQMCAGRSVDTVTLQESGGSFSDTWMFEKTVIDSGSIDIGVFDDAVALLDTGNAFELDASSSTNGAKISGPEFVSDDLAALANGEYLTAAGPLNQEGFDQMVGSYCG